MEGRTREERHGHTDGLHPELRRLAVGVAVLVAHSWPRPPAAVTAKVHSSQCKPAGLPHGLPPVLHVHHASACTCNVRSHSRPPARPPSLPRPPSPAWRDHARYRDRLLNKPWCLCMLLTSKPGPKVRWRLAGWMCSLHAPVSHGGAGGANACRRCVHALSSPVGTGLS